MTWEMARIVDQMNLTRLINHGRKRIGLPPVKDAWAHIIGENTLIAADKQIATIPGDIKGKRTQTGYMHLDLPVKFSPELDQFLAAGPPPIFAGFGSMPKTDQLKNLPLLVEAAQIVKKRIVISKSWERFTPFSNRDDVFFIQDYPHLRLFPKMSVVIHHGGAGTTATCAISGTPQIIVPHILDQFYHGHRVYLSHLGPKPIQRSRLSIGKLVVAIKDCMENEIIQKTVTDTAKAIDRKKNLELTIKNL